MSSLAQHRAHPARDQAKQLVADEVAQRVVHGLEAIEVDHQHGHRPGIGATGPSPPARSRAARRSKKSWRLGRPVSASCCALLDRAGRGVETLGHVVDAQQRRAVGQRGRRRSRCCARRRARRDEDLPRLPVRRGWRGRRRGWPRCRRDRAGCWPSRSAGSVVPVSTRSDGRPRTTDTARLANRTRQAASQLTSPRGSPCRIAAMWAASAPSDADRRA